jgi:putative hydrolase of the HAD superfamily
MDTSFDPQRIKLEGIRGLLVDLDNTLYEYEPCHKQALAHAYAYYNTLHPMKEEDFYTTYKEAQTVVKGRITGYASSHSRLLYFQTLTELLEKRTNIQVSLTLEEVYWKAFSDTIVLRENLIDFLQQCKKKSIKLCLITDLTAGVQFRKIVALGLDSLFDFVVTSEETGTDKPHPSMFQTALAKLNLRNDEVLMIGDDITKDIDGARNQNITAILV